jgi:cortactin
MSSIAPQERLSIAETVEEVDDVAWKEEVEEHLDEWKEEELNPYAEAASANLETVTEENGSSTMTAVALYELFLTSLLYYVVCSFFYFISILFFHSRYDYQAGAEDELSFDPDDIITNIEMVNVFLSFKVNFNKHIL